MAELMEITIDKAPRCHWHSDCATAMGRSGILRVVEHTETDTLFECQHCGKRGRFPVGGSFGVPHCVPVEQPPQGGSSE